MWKTRVICEALEIYALLKLRNRCPSAFHKDCFAAALMMIHVAAWPRPSAIGFSMGLVQISDPRWIKHGRDNPLLCPRDRIPRYYRLRASMLSPRLLFLASKSVRDA